jgi:acyl-coenzyme A thioesterase PaaI-like protein
MITTLMRLLGNPAPPRLLRFLFNLYPPYLGAGIKVEEISDNYQYLRVRLKLRFYNRNYVGIQFGGSMYSMTDPHYMLLLINNLGPEYIVLDKAASIDYVKPGKTDVIAEFRIDDALINTVKEKTKDGDKYFFDLPVNIVDINGQLIATLVKTLYVRKKIQPA